MTKQEEIREGIKKGIADYFGVDKIQEPFLNELPDSMVAYLHSQSVVIRVKCPSCVWSQFGDEATGMTPCYHCNSTGYLIEPLIKED